MKVLTGADLRLSRGVLHFCLQWQPRDCWYGLFVDCWTREEKAFYVTIIPCFPLHIKVVRA